MRHAIWRLLLLEASGRLSVMAFNIDFIQCIHFVEDGSKVIHIVPVIIGPHHVIDQKMSEINFRKNILIL